MTKIQIIKKLWSSIYDLLLLQNGSNGKTLKAIEKDLQEIEIRCKKYEDEENKEDIC